MREILASTLRDCKTENIWIDWIAANEPGLDMRMGSIRRLTG